MIEIILASYGCSYLLVGYIGIMDSLFNWVDKITEPDMEKARKEMDKISNILKQIEKEILGGEDA